MVLLKKKFLTLLREKLTKNHRSRESTKFVNECLKEFEKEKHEDFLEKLVDILTKRNSMIKKDDNNFFLHSIIQEYLSF